MAINFPINPSNGDTITEGDTTWQFDGTSWNVVVSSSSVSIPNVFNTISVSGQSDIVAGSTNDTLNIAEGSNVTITTEPGTNTLTIASTGGGGGEGGEPNQNAFSNIAVSGQNTIEADNTTDTLTLVAGAGINIITNQGTDSITLSASAAAVSDFTDLDDATTAGMSVDKFYEHAIQTFRLVNNSASAYRFSDHYGITDNPTIYVISGTTVAFDLNNISGHPFEIQDSTGTQYNTGLVHVANDGTVVTGSNAQGKESGTLYWRIPETTTSPPNFRYQCTLHAAMVGAITIKDFSAL